MRIVGMRTDRRCRPLIKPQNFASKIKSNESAEPDVQIARLGRGVRPPMDLGCASTQSPATSRIECRCTVVEFARGAGSAIEGRFAVEARRSRSAHCSDAGRLALFHAL